jgi:hypothetical protein
MGTLGKVSEAWKDIIVRNVVKNAEDDLPCFFRVSLKIKI